VSGTISQRVAGRLVPRLLSRPRLSPPIAPTALDPAHVSVYCIGKDPKDLFFQVLGRIARC